MIEGGGFTATATETTIMAPEIAAGGLGMFFSWKSLSSKAGEEKRGKIRGGEEGEE
jgi:hypothetical protein